MIKLKPKRVDIRIIRGASFFLELDPLWDEEDQPFDLTGYEALLQIRDFPTADEAVVSLTETGGIILGEDGSITLEILPEDTSLLTRDGVWDLRITTDEGKVIFPYQGRVHVSTPVSRG
jgi:hypothetical protein